MNIVEIDPDLLTLDLIGDDERGYDFLDKETIINLKEIYSTAGVLSVYLDLTPEAVQSNPVMTRFKNGVKAIREQQENDWSREEKQTFDGVVDDVSDWLQNQPTAIKGKGIALFAVPSRLLVKKGKVDYDLFVAFHLPEAPADLVNWGQTAVISPLVVQKDEHPETGVVVFDKEKIHFYLYSMGEVAEYSVAMKNPESVALTKSHTWHGWGEHNHKNWQQEHYKRFLRQAGIAINKVAEKAGWKWLVLASPDEQEAKHLVDYLPASLKSKFIGCQTLSLSASLNEVRDQVAALVREAELREEKEKLDEWTNELEKPNGLAVAGVADTVLADQEYRLKTLIYPAGFIQKGWQCQQCQALFADLQDQAPEKCPYCESEQFIKKSDIIGDMAAHVLQTGGDVEVIRDQEHRRIAEANGIVGGLLRY